MTQGGFGRHRRDQYLAVPRGPLRAGAEDHVGSSTVVHTRFLKCAQRFPIEQVFIDNSLSAFSGGYLHVLLQRNRLLEDPRPDPH